MIDKPDLSINKSLHERSELISMNIDYLTNQIELIANEVTNCIKESGKIFFCGNGGSAAESQHMAAEYCATLDHNKPRVGMAALALTTDSSFLTAWGNDFGYDGIFKRQLETLGQSGDLLFAYSTSGNSKNVCIAAEYAISNKIIVVGMTGNHENTELEKNSDILLKAPSSKTPNIQEIHTIVGHEVCKLVEQKIFNFT